MDRQLELATDQIFQAALELPHVLAVPLLKFVALAHRSNGDTTPLWAFIEKQSRNILNHLMVPALTVYLLHDTIHNIHRSLTE